MRHTFLLGRALVVAALGAAACGGTTDPNGNPPGDDTPQDEWDVKLGEREVDYNAALRIASLRLTGQLPMLSEIKAVRDAGSLDAQKVVYASFVRSYIESPAFSGQIVRFWRDAFKMGESTMTESAPLFAALVTVANRPFGDLLTATSGTCPTFNAQTNTFTSADCQNGVASATGLLSHPGVMAQFYSNMAFRRVRWVQETFACTAFPAEQAATPVDLGAAQAYISPWPFQSIAGTDNGGTVNFHDTSAVVCANCHSTMNHLAPLFANFDDQGAYKTDIQVKTPNTGTPLAKPTDWLPTGESTAWRYGTPVADLPALGAAMAADPKVAECVVARVWNWALGKGDIVDTLATVPSDVITAQVAAFQTGGGKVKDAIFAVYTSDDFVKF